ncbi:helix-hairpin-helix domain-containing protein [Virgibacillus xinjiangensis]|uniref:Helix-hairpin-helix domain-containing protein n=1 Tax=Virgibacillus xinjiangensis TaxID=393090 RepID=A0ABV7CRV6_9BACI
MLSHLKKGSLFLIFPIFLLVFFLIMNQPSDEPIAEEVQTAEHIALEQDEDVREGSGIVIVDVKGEVADPGVYEISTDARLNDVIQMAGGFTEGADQSQVNLAQKVTDEMMVLIPEKMDPLQNDGASEGAPEKLRINYATTEEIQGLSGIGPSKAEAIVQYREEQGLFQSAEDLLQISGIGEKTLEGLLDHIQVP